MSEANYQPGSHAPVVSVEGGHVHVKRLGGGSHESYTYPEWDAMVAKVEEARRKNLQPQPVK